MSARRSHAIEGLVVVALIAVVLMALWSQPADRKAAGVASIDAVSGSFIVAGARVFDGERDLGVIDVVVRDGRIAAVGAGAAEDLDLPRLDGTGRTLLPGLIDAHVHAWGEARRDMARFGVTTGFDMHGDAGHLPEFKAEREGLENTKEADLWAAGFAVTAPGGHGTQFGLAVPTVDADTDIDAFVAARIAEGADYIKLIIEDLGAYGDVQRLPTLGDVQVGALVEATHARGRMAVAHVSTLASARMAVAAGVDGLVHVFGDAPIDEALLATIRERGVFVVPTLIVAVGMVSDDEPNALAEDPSIKPWLDVEQLTSLQSRFDVSRPAQQENVIESVRRLHAAGVPILAGSDAPNPGTAHGASLHAELALLVRAGLSPAEALATATSIPARIFHVPERGHIAPGMRADLVLVEGNPLDDISATRRIVKVWKNAAPIRRDPGTMAEMAEMASSTRLIGDFEQDVDVDSGRWQATSDSLVDGTSTASVERVAGGARGSTGALLIRGEIRAGFAFPWAGAAFFPGSEPMQPVDYSGRHELVFWVRGDGRRYRAMLLSGPSMQGMPSELGFVAGPHWQEVRLPLDAFRGADLARLRAIVFGAGVPAGQFEFRIDQVELR